MELEIGGIMNTYLVTFTKLYGLPKEEIVQFIIKSKNLSSAMDFITNDKYFIDIIKKGFPKVQKRNVNVVIYPLGKTFTKRLEILRKCKGPCAVVFSDEHQHISTYIKK